MASVLLEKNTCRHKLQIPGDKALSKIFLCKRDELCWKFSTLTYART
jgi:hypothetical protein